MLCTNSWVRVCSFPLQKRMSKRCSFILHHPRQKDLCLSTQLKDVLFVVGLASGLCAGLAGFLMGLLLVWGLKASLCFGMESSRGLLCLWALRLPGERGLWDHGVYETPGALPVWDSIEILHFGVASDCLLL